MLMNPSKAPYGQRYRHQNRSFLALRPTARPKRASKTGRLVITHEASQSGGLGAEVAASITERCFYHLEAPIERVTGWDTPYPHAQEWDYFPGPTRVIEGFKRAMEGK